MIAKLAIGLAVIRIFFGLGYLVAPIRVGGGWIGRVARLPQTQVFTRALGARDLVLGAGALTALADERADPRPWLAAQAAADAADFGATIAAAGALPRSGYRFALVMAGASTVVALAGALSLSHQQRAE